MPPADALLHDHRGDEREQEDGLQFEGEGDAEEESGECSAADDHAEGAEKHEAGVDNIGLSPDGAVHEHGGAGENTERSDELRDGSSPAGSGSPGEAADEEIRDNGVDNIESERDDLDLGYAVDMPVEIRGHRGDIEVGREIHAEGVLQRMPSPVLQQIVLPWHKGELKIGVHEVSPERDPQRKQRQGEDGEAKCDGESRSILRG